MKNDIDYNSMPDNPKQDNKTYKSGGGPNWNSKTIRYPKKCRKTAWKRFYRLFPDLKPDEEKNEK